MALNDSLVDQHGTQLYIVSTQAKCFIDLNILESDLLLTTFRISGPEDFIRVVTRLIGAGSYVGWLWADTESALSNALATEARRFRKLRRSQSSSSGAGQ